MVLGTWSFILWGGEESWTCFLMFWFLMFLFEPGEWASQEFYSCPFCFSFRERERTNACVCGGEWRGCAGGEGEKKSPADATPSTVSDRGLDPTTSRYDLSWNQVGSLINQATQVPLSNFFWGGGVGEVVPIHEKTKTLTVQETSE